MHKTSTTARQMLYANIPNQLRGSGLRSESARQSISLSLGNAQQALCFAAPTAEPLVEKHQFVLLMPFENRKMSQLELFYFSCADIKVYLVQIQDIL